MQYFFGITMFLVALFLILLVLVQRGRGGGLSGALGGMGGQSAFGTKAGDLFTRVTMIAAAVWILLCMASIKVLSTQPDKFGGSLRPGVGAATSPDKKDADKKDADKKAKDDKAGTGDAGKDSSSKAGTAGGLSGDTPAESTSPSSTGAEDATKK
jgi:preprotein translocase subunit SecG